MMEASRIRRENSGEELASIVIGYLKLTCFKKLVIQNSAGDDVIYNTLRDMITC